jgi:hypothetical protein
LKPCLVAHSAFCDEWDIAACDAEIVQLTVGQAVQFVAGLTNPVPVADVSKKIHFHIPSSAVSTIWLTGLSETSFVPMTNK